MLAHGVQLVDVGALLHQRTRRAAAWPRAESPAPAAPSAPSRRRTAARAADRRSPARGRHLERASRARHAAAVRQRMPGVIPGSRSAEAAIGLGDGVADRSPSMRAQRARRPRGARRSSIARGRLAGRDHVNGGRALQRARRSSASSSARRTSPPAFTADRAAPSAWTVGDRCRRSGDGRSVHLPGIGPGGKPGHDVELLRSAADDLIGICLWSHKLIELGHDFHERLFDVADGALGVVLALLSRQRWHLTNSSR